jgi:hypothetical protein
MATDQEMLEALNQIEAAVTGKAATAAGPDPAAICKQYRSIRNWLTMALPLVAAIPIYGSKISAAIGFLMTVADQACPAS